MIADVFEDDSSPGERRFGRLRELCNLPAWTVREAAWIICGFDSEGYRKGDYSHGETDGWLLLPGVTRDGHEPEPKGLLEEELRQLRWERFQERCDTDESRHSRIGMTALRLAGLLNGGMQSAHPPRVILEKAVAAGMAPDWLTYARADLKLADFLPVKPASRTADEPPAVPGSSSEEIAVELFPSLLAEINLENPNWRKRYKPSYAKLVRDYPYWSHILAHFHVLRTAGKNKDYVFEEMKRHDSTVGLKLVTSFTVKTVKGWDDRYEDATAIALAVLRWRLLDLENPRPDDGLPNLDKFLRDAEEEFAAKAKSS